jgi:hypothetical protein
MTMTLAHYQNATAHYGIMAHQAGLAWFKQQLKREVEQLASRGQP